MRSTTLLLLSLTALALAVSPAAAGTQDAAKVALHAQAIVTKSNPCGFNNDPNSQGIGCSSYVVDWTTHSLAWVYLVVGQADSAAGISYLDVGVMTQNPTTFTTWFQCVYASELPSTSPPWPDPGSGNTFTWGPCQQNNIAGEGTHAIAGTFYVYAYGTELLSLIPNPTDASTDIVVKDCASTTSIIPPDQTGRVGFDCSGGYNPCAGGPVPPGCPYFAISSITDIDPDQGSQVRIQWGPNAFDVPGGSPLITAYGIYRRIDPLGVPAAGARSSREPLAAEAYPPGSWDYVTGVPASAETEYNTVVPTLCDSCWSVFFVRALTDTPWVYFDTVPDSGMSFDNLAPMAPSAVTVSPAYLLSWLEPEDPDFRYFTVYGSAYETLDENAVVLGHTVDTQMDVSSTPYSFYHLTATDFAGNESEGARQVSSAATASGYGVTVALGPTVDLTFSTVTSGGETQLVLRSQGIPPPGGILTVPATPPLYYELSTTAAFDQVEVAVAYDETQVQGSESDLSLWHYDEAVSDWIPITTSVDVDNNVIRGVTTSFSAFMVGEPASASDVPGGLPQAPAMHPAFPNPFSRAAGIQYDLPEASPVRLRVYDLRGRLVRTLVDAAKSPGEHRAFWNGRDDRGDQAQNGVYFFRLETPGRVTARKAVLLR